MTGSDLEINSSSGQLEVVNSKYYEYIISLTNAF